jgi:hypothetical protein
MKRLVVLLPLAIVVLGLASIGTTVWTDHLSWSSYSITASIESGNRIIRAVDAFQEKEKKLPVALDELVPAYLDQIEPPLAGTRQWYYWLQHDQKHFHLQVVANEDKYPSLNYDSTYPDIGWYQDH